jgi:uncharacterized protein (TIGR00369 family)
MLPRTQGCLVCGRDNPHGLRLRLAVDENSGVVSLEIVPEEGHVGFAGVVHGGLIATVADEAMVWAATWAARRFCFCGEMTIRFRRPASPGMTLRFEARVESYRSKLVLTTFKCFDQHGQELSSGTGKYVPLSAEHHAQVIETFVDEPESREAAELLTRGNG